LHWIVEIVGVVHEVANFMIKIINF